MVNYWIYTSAFLGIVAVVEMLVLFRKSKEGKKNRELILEVRKGLREHHKAEAGLFKALDKTIVNLALRNIKPRKEEREQGEWSEYG